MKFWQVLVLIIVVVLTGLGISVWQPWKNTNRTIQVTADGKIMAVPDVSKITASVDVTKPTANEAQVEATKKTSAIIDAVKALGIAEKDIQTESVSTAAVYDYSEMKQKVSGYSGRSTITITVRKIDDAQKVLSTVTASGADSVYGPQLTFSDEKLIQIKEQAQVEAVKNAKNKAENLAQAGNAKIGKVVTISEADSSNGRYYPVFKGAVSSSDVSSAQPSDVIQPGENEITVTVTITFSLK